LGKRYEGELRYSLMEVDALFWKNDFKIRDATVQSLKQLQEGEVQIPYDFEWGDSEQEQKFYLKIEEILLFGEMYLLEVFFFFVRTETEGTLRPCLSVKAP